MPGYFDSKYNNNTCHDKFLEFIHFYYKTDTRQKMNTHNARSCDSTRSLIVAKYLEISFLCKVQEKKHLTKFIKSAARTLMVVICRNHNGRKRKEPRGHDFTR